MRNRKQFTAPKMGLPFGIGVLYLMVHIPFFWWWKIGITGVGVGASKRAKRIGQSVFGFPVPIMIVPVPFCYHIEQGMHRFLSPLNFRFYKKDGSTEWFWFPAVAFAVPVIGGIWAGYLMLLSLVFNIEIMPGITWIFGIFT